MAACRATPEQVGLSAERLAEIGPFVQRYIDAQEMSGAITIIARRGKVIHFEDRQAASGAQMEGPDLSSLEGDEARLRVTMENAKLYTFQIRI